MVVLICSACMRTVPVYHLHCIEYLRGRSTNVVKLQGSLVTYVHAGGQIERMAYVVSVSYT